MLVKLKTLPRSIPEFTALHFAFLSVERWIISPATFSKSHRSIVEIYHRQRLADSFILIIPRDALRYIRRKCT